jgi:hypothetical protein
MGKERYIFQMAHFSKVGLIWAKLKEKIIYLFTQMDLIIEDSLDNLKKMDMDNFFIILDWNFLEHGEMVHQMEKIVNKYMKIKAFMKVSLLMESNLEGEFIIGQTEKFILVNSKVAWCKAMELLKKDRHHFLKVILNKIKFRGLELWDWHMEHMKDNFQMD